MTPVVLKSPFNPIQFIGLDVPQNPAYHTIHPGSAWERQTYPKGVLKEEYFYKAEVADIIEHQFNITIQGGGDVELQLLKPYRTPTGTGADVIWTWTAPTPVILSNNTVLVDGVEYAMGCLHFVTSFAEVTGITPGTYYFRLKFEYASSGLGAIDRVHYEISEPVDVKVSHPGTILLRATNATNDYDTIFVQTGAEFRLRTEGAIHDEIYDADTTFHKSQRGVNQKLYDRPSVARRLTIGGGKGVARWVKQCAHYLMSADYKDVDGVEITKYDSSEWEIIRAGNHYPLGGMSMTVAYGDPAANYKTLLRPHVVLFTRESYPYFIHDIGIFSVSFGSAIFIASPAQEKALLNRLNQAVLNSQYRGYVAKIGAEFRYYFGATEAEEVSITEVFYKYIKIVTDPDTVFLTIEGTKAGIVWSQDDTVAWGDGTPDTLVTNKAYTAEATAYLFHDNTIEELNIGGGDVKEISGTIPTLTDYSIDGTKIGVFDIAHLAPARTTLETLEIDGNQLTNILNTTSLALPVFTQLKTINAASNKLPVSVVNQLIEDVDDMVHGSGVTTGFLALNGQTPAAAPTGAGVTAKNHLITNHGWGVSTD